MNLVLWCAFVCLAINRFTCLSVKDEIIQTLPCIDPRTCQEMPFSLLPEQSHTNKLIGNGNTPAALLLKRLVHEVYIPSAERFES
ncbi:hypothetical protein GGS21DRAFT_344852 [Xylaria nigripes]|nr:hypothetical protein GGS21DRAFT_344852 [Xylaria nigripes]